RSRQSDRGGLRRLRHEADRPYAAARENHHVAARRPPCDAACGHRSGREALVSSLTRRQSDLAIASARTRVPSQLLHELRNPLNQIIGYAEMLAEGEEAERHERFVSDLENIRAAGHRMLALIEENFTSFDDKAFLPAVGDDDDAPSESLPAQQLAPISGVL